jgi:hypothetical protein
VPGGPVLFVQHGYVVRRVLVGFEKTLSRHVFVAGFARVRANVVRCLRTGLIG